MRRVVHRKGQRGQALVMVTLALFVICGMLGLAVDLGWSYFREKAARAAADSAAISAAKAAFANLGQNGSYTCGSLPSGSCQATALNCSSLSAGPLYIGCQYAQQNGFTDGQNNTTVKMQADAAPSYAVCQVRDLATGNCTTTANINTQYWVKAVAAESIPQLFSAILGHSTGVSSALSTAAVVKVLVNGALILLNRENDCALLQSGNGNGTTTVCGEDLKVQANNNQGAFALQTSGNILLSSSCAGSRIGSNGCVDGNSAAYAGVNQGGGTVCTGDNVNGNCRPTAGTFIAGGGGAVCGSGNGNSNCTTANWNTLPTNGADPAADPMAGKAQPTAPSGLADIPVLNGTISSSATIPNTNQPLCPGGVCSPGNYYAVNSSGAATGGQLTVSGTIRFAACSGCSAGTSFGQYVFFGGLTGVNGSNAQFDPGQYMFAGAIAGNNGPGSLLNTTTGFSLTDATSGTGQNSDAGELFVFTDATYQGLQVPLALASIQSSLKFGTANFSSGTANGNPTTINLHGLNAANSNVPSNLQTLAPTLVWQDQRNVYGAQNEPAGSPELDLQASPNVHLYGVIYQPRGAWTTLTGGGGYTGALQLISGALNVQGNAHIELTAPLNPLTITKVALIE